MLRLKGAGFGHILFRLRVGLKVVRIFAITVARRQFAICKPGPTQRNVTIVCRFQNFLINNTYTMFEGGQRDLDRVGVFGGTGVGRPIVGRQVKDKTGSTTMVTYVTSYGGDMVHENGEPFGDVTIFVNGVCFGVCLVVRIRGYQRGNSVMDLVA